MAGNDDGQERTEQASFKRLEEAREKGQIARSRELNTLVVLMAAAGGMWFLGNSLMADLAAFMRHALQFERAQVFDSKVPTHALQQSLFNALDIMTPLLICLVLAASLAPLLLGGWSFSAKALRFDAAKLNPIKGLGKLFSAHSAMELVKAIIKCILLGAVTAAWLWQHTQSLLNLSNETVTPALMHAGDLLISAFFIICAGLIIVAAVDAPFQLWNHAKQLKMTRQEVRDEGKETEGSPEVKGRIRTLQREMAKRRMMAEVPKADVIITNPTHYAVALRYDQNKMRAPKLVAKGADLIAQQIRNVGQAAGVQIISAPTLARAVYFHTELEEEIPAGLYMAVAQLLAYVYQLRHGRDARPPLPDFPIPEEYKKD